LEQENDDLKNIL